MGVNPYEPPRCNRPHLTPQRHALSLVFVVLAGTGTAATLGAITNAINAAISPEYFCLVMRWSNDGTVWARSVIQGAIEGAGYGLAFSLVFLLVIALAFESSYSPGKILRLFPKICVAVFLVWGLGGAIGVAWAALDAESYRDMFPIVPYEGVLRFGWVGGSIYGIVYGGFLVVVTSAFVIAWRRSLVGRAVANSDD